MTAWWSEERINATVNQQYIERELGSKRYVDSLHSVLGFGDGLTDDTYLDWILERSPRIFLILNSIGAPERIFGIIDRSFADDDLPLSQDALWELNLFGGKSETLDKKFYREQFNFLIQELEAGGHTEYGAWDVIPVDPLPKRPGIKATQSNDKVQVKNCVYTRKKVAIDSGIDEVPFVMHLKALTNIRHSHLVTVFSTYAQDSINYILLTPSTELTLKSFLDEPPKTFKTLEKWERRNIFMTWTHCLTSALAYLHEQGLSHLSIRPSTILVDSKNSIFFGDYGALKTLEADEQKAPYNNEVYEHSPPENWLRQPQLHETAPLKTYLPGGGRTSRKIPKAAPLDPKNKLSLPQSPSSLTRTKTKSVSSGSSGNTRPRNAFITTIAPVQREGSISSSQTHRKRDFAADVFSHTTILLLLLSQILQHSPKSFASHRSRLNRQAGRGSAPPDASFHKNLPQVESWIDMLLTEAGQREKKDMKFWGAMVEIVQICRLGVVKEAKDRIQTRDLEQKIAGWVDWGLARQRTCSCSIKEEERTVIKTKGRERSKPELASQYRIPQLQGGAELPHLLQAKQKVEYPGDVQSEPSVDLQVGVCRAIKIDPRKESSIWGLPDNDILRPKDSISVISDKESTIWGLDEVPEDGPRDTLNTLNSMRKGGNMFGRSQTKFPTATSCFVGPAPASEQHLSDDDTEDGNRNATTTTRIDKAFRGSTSTATQVERGIRGSITSTMQAAKGSRGSTSSTLQIPKRSRGSTSTAMQGKKVVRASRGAGVPLKKGSMMDWPLPLGTLTLT